MSADDNPSSVSGPTHMRGPTPLGAVRRTVREVGLALITLGVIVLLFVVYQLYGTTFTEEHNQAALAKEFSAAITAGTVPTTTVPAASTAVSTAVSTTTTVPLPTAPTGQAIDHLVIPKLGLNKFVVEGTDENDLREGPGHYTGTAYPGQVGNVAIAGHRTTYGAPFFELNRMTTGDMIYLTDLADRTWVYKVSQPPVVVSPNDVSVLDPTTFAQLTLTTCNPRFSATTRLIVFARLVGRALPAAASPTSPTVIEPVSDGPASHPSTSKPAVGTLAGADSLGGGNHNAWPPTILYGLLLIAGWVVVRLFINRTRSWYRLGAYVVGIGLCLIPLWFTFENAILLLPQSI